VDKELKKLVELLNTVDGIETIDSCFGHSEEPERICNHHSYAFIGFEIISKNGNLFITKLIKDFSGKRKIQGVGTTLSQWVQIVVNSWIGCPIEKPKCFSLEVHPAHNPAFKKEGVEEKLIGIQMLENYICGGVSPFDLVRFLPFGSSPRVRGCFRLQGFYCGIRVVFGGVFDFSLF